MGNKFGPYLLLSILAIVLFFILGVRYGQRVEKTNKQLAVLPTPTKAKEEPLKFSKLDHKGCGLEFLYPSSLKLKETTQSATLSQDGKATIAFSCEKTNPFLAQLADQKVASEEFDFQGKKIEGQKKMGLSENLIFITLQNAVNRKSVYFMVNDSLFPLFESSLKFRTSQQ